MNRQTWTFLDDQNRRRKVNLFHSPRDGKLLIQVDGETVVATVHAKEAGRWSFLIEEELCDIIVVRRGLEFLYGFEINRKAPTARNRIIRQRERRDLWLPLGIFLVCLLAGAGFLFGRKWMKKQASPAQFEQIQLSADQLAALSRDGKTTIAHCLEGKNGLIYSFKPVRSNANATGDSIQTGGLFLEKKVAGKFVLPNGLPLEKGDEFRVTYLPKTPAVHQLDFMQLTENQVIVYQNRAAGWHHLQHPELSKAWCACLVRQVWRRTGLRGLADIFFQKTPPAEYADHNSDSFGRLIRDENFKKMVADSCWGK